jgi:hypothetical protein
MGNPMLVIVGRNLLLERGGSTRPARILNGRGVGGQQ